MDLPKHMPGADAEFAKGGGAVGSGARSQYFFGQLRGLFKGFGAKRGGRAPPPPPLIRACMLKRSIIIQNSVCLGVVEKWFFIKIK